MKITVTVPKMAARETAAVDGDGDTDKNGDGARVCIANSDRIHCQEFPISALFLHRFPQIEVIVVVIAVLVGSLFYLCIIVGIFLFF